MSNHIHRYESRWEFVMKRCSSKKVLHLGCIGFTEEKVANKVEAMVNGRVLHAQLRCLSKQVVGIDYDMDTIKELQNMGFNEILVGDVQQLENVNIGGTFDVILCGDLIEHLSEPGRLIEGIKRFMHAESEVIITTPNCFGLMHFIRYLLGSYREGNDHVLSFSIYTLRNLLTRHGYFVSESYTCFNRPAISFLDKVNYSIGIPFFKIFPKFGGTLCVVAKLQS